MRTLFLASSFLVLSGCSMIPSFWDDNEALLVAKVRFSVDQMDCKTDYRPQAEAIVKDIRFLELYAESKGSSDVISMVIPMKETASAIADKEPNIVYCNIKKKLLEKQSATIADAMMERF